MYVGPWQELRLAQFLKEAADVGEGTSPPQRRRPKKPRRSVPRAPPREEGERERRLRGLRRLYGLEGGGGGDKEGERLAPTPVPPLPRPARASPGPSHRQRHDPLAQGARWVARNRVVCAAAGEADGAGAREPLAAAAGPAVPHRVRMLPRKAPPPGREPGFMGEDELERLHELIEAGRRAEEELERRRRSVTPLEPVHYRGETVPPPGARPPAMRVTPRGRRNNLRPSLLSPAGRASPYMELMHPPATRSDSHLYDGAPSSSSPPSPRARGEFDRMRAALASAGSDFDGDVDDLLGWAEGLGAGDHGDGDDGGGE